MINCALDRDDRIGVVIAREATGKDHRGSLRNDDDPLADLATKEVGCCGLPSSGPAGEDNAATVLGGALVGGRGII